MRPPNSLGDLTIGRQRTEEKSVLIIMSLKLMVKYSFNSEANIFESLSLRHYGRMILNCLIVTVPGVAFTFCIVPAIDFTTTYMYKEKTNTKSQC